MFKSKAQEGETQPVKKEITKTNKTPRTQLNVFLRAFCVVWVVGFIEIIEINIGQAKAILKGFIDGDVQLKGIRR
jgi:hypothetical protein